MFLTLHVDMRIEERRRRLRGWIVIRLHEVWENLAKPPISHKWEALERNACKGKVPPVKQHKGILLVTEESSED